MATPASDGLSTLELVGLVLGILGLFGWSTLSELVRNSLLRRWHEHTWSEHKLSQVLETVVSKHLILLETPFNVAMFGPPVHVNWYVDLMSAATGPKELRELTRCLVRLAFLKLRRNPTVIAVPKLGNVLLGAQLAQRLGVRLVLMRQDERTRVRGGASIDGHIHAGDLVLIVDDVASDGEFLGRCVEIVRKQQALPVAVMVLVERREWQCAGLLSKQNVPLISLKSYADSDLKLLAEITTPLKG